MDIVVWDWNGTLLDDVPAAVFALDSMLAKRGIAPVDVEFYRANFRFPSRDFYLQLGVDLEHEDWGKICDDFHGGYNSYGPQRLRVGAVEALAACRAAGLRQVLLSAHREDLLAAEAAKLGVAQYFDAIAGTDNLSGASKLDRAKRLVADLPSRNLLFVGDTIHDAEVAAAVGAKCHLLTCGHQNAARLASCGARLFPSLGDWTRAMFPAENPLDRR